MKTTIAILLGGIMCAVGCQPGNGGDGLGGSSGIPCATMYDCPPTDAECVIALCVDGECQDVDLTTSPDLPIDPESGLPIGKHCHTTGCQCEDAACLTAPEGAACAFCDLLGVCSNGACVQEQAGPPFCG
jgi:hypothetical protein